MVFLAIKLKETMCVLYCKDSHEPSLMLIQCKKLGSPCSSHQELAKCPTSGFEKKIGIVDLGGPGDVEEYILDVIEFEFPHEVDGHVEDCIQDWDMYP